MESRNNNSTERSKDIRTINDLGTIGSRSYECVFCKGGFTTAQALGGHMNIHRKNRTKPKLNAPSNSSSSLNHESNTINGLLSPPCCNEINRCSSTDGSGTQYDPGVLLSNYSAREIGERKLAEGGGFNYMHHHHHHVVVEELDLELRLGHHRS